MSSSGDTTAPIGEGGGGGALGSNTGGGSSGSSSSGGAYVDATASAIDHCEQMCMIHADLADNYYRMISKYCSEKLWHQLTNSLLDFVHENPITIHRTTTGTSSSTGSTEETAGDNGIHVYMALYDRVVLSVETKIKPLSLVRIASAVANAIAVNDMIAAKAILENLLANKKESLGPSATIYLQSKLNLLTLRGLLASASGGEAAAGGGGGSSSTAAAAAGTPSADPNNPSTKAALKSIHDTMQSNASMLSEMVVTKDHVDQAIVHAAHYEQAMTYHKVVGPPEAFYKQAIQFLNYSPPPSSSTSSAAASSSEQEEGKEQQSTAVPKVLLPGMTDYHQLAVDLCLAALTGDGVYNLGEVLVQQQPLLTLLTSTSDGWLVEMLVACAEGNVTEFNNLTTKYETQIAAQPALVHRATAVKEKLALLALVSLIFNKASSERNIHFHEIATALQVSIEQVEWVIMRALSVHLIEGTMNQVEQTVTITWVLPRILNNTQMMELATRFGEWAVQVSKIKDAMSDRISPTFAA